MSSRIDVSYVIGTSNFDQNTLSGVRSLMARITERFTVGSSNVYVAMQSYTSSSRTVFNFNRWTRRSDLIRGFNELRIEGGSLNTREAYRYLRTQLYTLSRGARSGAARVAILFVRGNAITGELQGQRVNEIRAEIRQLEAAGIRVIVVSDQNASGGVLRLLLTGNSAFYWSAASFADISRNTAVISEIVEAVAFTDFAGKYFKLSSQDQIYLNLHRIGPFHTTQRGKARLNIAVHPF